MRVPRAASALTLACLLLAPTAAADEELSLIDLLGPSLGVLDRALLDLGDAVAPSPAAPILLPAIDLGRVVVQVLRATAEATVIGAQDGDAGSTFGTPDEVGVVSEERVVVDGVAVPGQEVTIPGRTISLDIPGVNRTIVTPPIGVPGQTIVIPGRVVSVDLPPVTVPGLEVHTPPIGVDTPPVSTPPVRVVVPAVRVPGQQVHLDASGADVTVQELHGTVYVGPVAVPYSVGPTTVGQSQLPGEIPRTLDAATPAVDVLPQTEVLHEPAHEVVPSRRLEVPAQEVHVSDEQEVFPGAHVTEVEVPGQRVDTPAVAVLPRQEVPVHTEPVHVATLEVPGQHVATPPVVVSDEQVVAPAVDQRADPFGDVDDLGYVGYGRDGDSSLYPYACTAVVGCQRTQPALRPWVQWADAWVETAAGLVDGPVVVHAEEPHLVFPQ